MTLLNINQDIFLLVNGIGAALGLLGAIILAVICIVPPRTPKPKAIVKKKTPVPPAQESNVIAYGRYTNVIKSPYKY